MQDLPDATRGQGRAGRGRRREADVYRRPVDSTLIRSVGYDLPGSVLEVELVDGHVYEYYDVALTIYSELMAAESPGSYFNDHIKDMYAYSRVDEDGGGGDDPAPEA